MEMSPFQTWRQGVFGGVFILLITSFGCSRSSLRELPFLRSADRTENTIKASFPTTDSPALTIWHDSFESAQQRSKETGKPILADFTGSDWCSWCVKLKKDVFETSEFQAWARENVILLELDYPKRAIQSSAIRNQNKQLAERYKISGYPTVLLLDSEGEVLGKLGYMKQPSDWIAAAKPILEEQTRSTVAEVNSRDAKFR